MIKKGISFLAFSLLIPLVFSFIKNDTVANLPDDFVVVLDAGHGGHDPGNLGNGYLEKEIALNIVLEVGKQLEKTKGIKVVYTRKDDTFVDLYKRGEIANKANADLFVSVHCDSHNSDANGAGTFVLGLHANKQNFEVAKKENSVIYLEDNYAERYAQYDINSPESVIGLTIMQEEFLDQSIQLAKFMQDNFTSRLKRKDRKVKQAGFIVLHQTFMPSVLVETGFLTNKDEGSFLNSEKGQQDMGKAIADAIVKYKESIASGLTAGEDIPPISDVVATPKEEPAAPPKKETIVEEKEPAPKQVEQVVENTSEKVEKKLPETDDTSKNEEVTAIVKKEEPPITQTTETVVNDAPNKPVVVQKISSPKENSQMQAEAAKPAEETNVVSKASITFKVQLMASSKVIPLQPKNFKGLDQLSKEPYKNLYRYLYGDADSYMQAKILKSNANASGYTTSYIVAYKDGERIALKDALELLDEK